MGRGIGDVVICVDITGLTSVFKPPLTLGKEYVIKEIDTKTYYVFNDSGNRLNYMKHRFKLLSEIREEKINDILSNKNGLR